VKNVPPVVAAADTAVVAVDTAVVVAAVDTAVVVAAVDTVVVAEAVVAPVALAATAADIAKTLPTVLRMGVESNSPPPFSFYKSYPFVSSILPELLICHQIVTFVPRPIAQNKGRDLHPDLLR
jgi:ABC-type amino acid transport substrate-binding protein